MKLLIANVRGRMGARILAELLAPEFRVRIIDPSPGQLPQEIRGWVEIIEGDPDDPGTLDRALEGVEAMFWSVPADFWNGPGWRERCETAARVTANAIRRAGTARVVTLSALGAGHAGGLLASLHRVEEILNGSGAAIRHLRAGWWMEHLLDQLSAIEHQGQIALPWPHDRVLPLVALNDVVDAALRWLVKRLWLGVDTLEIQGRESLTGPQAATLLELVLEMRVRYEEIQVDEYVGRLTSAGCAPANARVRAQFLREILSNAFPAPVGEGEVARQTSFLTWARQELVPRLARETSCGVGRALEACADR